MLTKCICTNCAGHLEFEEENAGERIPCPHCGFETTLYLPGTEPPSDEEEAALWVRLLRNRMVWAGAFILVIAGFLFFLYRWGVPWVWDFLPWIESTAGAMIFLIVACLVLPFLVVWLIFPVILMLQIRKLTRVLEAGNASQIVSYEPISEAETELDTEPEQEPISPEEKEPEAG